MSIEQISRKNCGENAPAILGKYKSLVWPKIQNYLASPKFPPAFQIPAEYKEEEESHWKIASEYPKRQGKYLRPTLLLLTAESMGADAKRAISTAAAMQISEEWLLIHDDFEDNSRQRRGKPTLHRMYGNELAVNAGDALQVLMWKILTDNFSILGQEKSVKILDEFYTMLMRTTIGQTTEIRWSQENKTDFSDEDWFFICDGKTSYYTIAGPMRLGAIIAGASKKQFNSLAKFGVYLGRCYQIIDDVLDLTSDFEGLKKQTGNDIYEGKRTLILGHLLRNIKGKDKKEFLSIMSKARDEKSQDEVDWVIEKMNGYKSIEYAQSIAKKIRDKAEKTFDKELKFLSKEPARERIRTLINFTLERQR